MKIIYKDILSSDCGCGIVKNKRKLLKIAKIAGPVTFLLYVLEY